MTCHGMVAEQRGESQGSSGLSPGKVVRFARMHDRFFESPRGKIVAALRERRSASAVDLAALCGVSPNAIRQQLLVLERDGLVRGRSVRRGKTKPTVAFELTLEAERFFPQRYDKMLNAVLREIREDGGPARGDRCVRTDRAPLGGTPGPRDPRPDAGTARRRRGVGAQGVGASRPISSAPARARSSCTNIPVRTHRSSLRTPKRVPRSTRFSIPSCRARPSKSKVSQPAAPNAVSR